MKQILLAATFLATSSAAQAQEKTIVVDSGTTQTVTGVGGNATLTYAFAKGDKITIAGHASKQLERMKVVLYPGTPFGGLKYTKDLSYTFTMSEAGFCMFTFISDRGGKNMISYNITRVPASAATEAYVTKVTWEKAADKSNKLEPKQAGK